ncbi:NUDIX domain-containing protein [Lysinibacillus sp. 54212]|uniref:NUDIX domain-containing protein n=1 Tax=Lysinibacillus sp. 54212 TaxID=3119829 RepID=UPI002FC9B923
MKKDRGKVWLGVSAVVENQSGEWLVVKKSYGGLKGRWSLPAGFVDEGETIDEGAIREVKEETGIDCVVHGLIGFRTGVIREEISDNMAIFYCHMVEYAQEIVIEEREILEARWIHPKDLAVDERSSVMIVEMAQYHVEHYMLNKIEGINPGDIFGYTKYNFFFNK